MKTILIAVSSKEILKAVKTGLGDHFQILEALSYREALSMLDKKRPDLCFIDLLLLSEPPDNLTDKDSLKPFFSIYPTMPVVAMAPQKQVRHAVDLVRSGALDYLTYPIDPEELKYVIERAGKSIITQSELNYLRDEFWDPEWLKTVQTNNPVMRNIYEKIRAVAPTKSTVLITGETGTGKSVIASLIHRHSHRRNFQFISVHCGAIPDTLIESELFGHEKGAFTDASRRKLGKFEIASGGTIFLDEVGTLTPAAQIKLLQVLQEGIYERVGGEQVLKCDVRTIAASNSDLKKMSEEKTFRSDLYYRLNVFPIEVPPLRERIEDIPHLAELFISKLNKYYDKGILNLHEDVLEAMLNYTWPGNIRELENLIERAYIIENKKQLTPESFPVQLFESTGTARISLNTSMNLANARQRAVEDFERKYLAELLLQNNGKIKQAAEAAGITSRQLNKLMSKYGIKKESYKI